MCVLCVCGGWVWCCPCGCGGVGCSERKEEGEVRVTDDQKFKSNRDSKAG